MRLGYDRTFADLPADASPARRLPFVGGQWHGIRLDSERRRILLPPGAALDVGGIAKGMAVDAALDRLERELGIGTALVDAGGDLAVRGLPPGTAGLARRDRGHDVLCRPPARRARNLGLVAPTLAPGRGRAPSSDRPPDGRARGSGLSSVTVAAATCRQAEVGATAVFVLGATDGTALLERHGLAGLLVGSSEVETVGRWPEHRVAA